MKAQQILNIVYMSSLGLVLYTETQLASSVIKFFTYRQLNVNIFAKTTFFSQKWQCGTSGKRMKHSWISSTVGSKSIQPP